MSGNLLVVHHGAGRGRAGPFLEQTLQHLSEARPALRRSVASHATGDDAPSLRGISAVLFWLADPLRERYPQCFADASRIAERANQAGIPVFNAPDALSNSIKSIQARLWRNAGLPTPRHERFDREQDLLSAVDGLSYPLLVKSEEWHGQHMKLCSGVDDLHAEIAPPRRLFARRRKSKLLRMPVSVSGFVDTREGYRAHAPDPLWSAYFHKQRAIVLGDIVHPRHVIFSTKPIVSLDGSTLADFAKRQDAAGDALPLDAVTRLSVEADNRFFFAPPEGAELLRAACSSLGFATAAIDYSTHANGDIVLWEANPYFLLYSPDTYILPEPRRFKERRSRLFADVEAFIEGLVT